jgi:hypothetical protein
VTLSLSLCLLPSHHVVNNLLFHILPLSWCSALPLAASSGTS